MIVGVDPGLDGGIAVLSLEGKVLDRFPMPVEEDGSMGVLELFRWAQDLEVGATVYLERSVAFKMGRTSAFNYGVGWGEVRTAFILAGLCPILVMPSVWHASLFPLKGRDLDQSPKERALAEASRLFGDAIPIVGKRKKRPHEGVVDALLIAEYGRRLSRCSGTSPCS